MAPKALIPCSLGADHELAQPLSEVLCCEVVIGPVWVVEDSPMSLIPSSTITLTGSGLRENIPIQVTQAR